MSPVELKNVVSDLLCPGPLQSSFPGWDSTFIMSVGNQRLKSVFWITDHSDLVTGAPSGPLLPKEEEMFVYALNSA